MELNSVLTPEKITGRQKSTIGEAQNFISGGSPLGDSIVSSAANKIIGFQRSAAVRPVIPDVNSIISSISSNIVNNLDNTVNKSSDITKNIVENKIQNFKNEIINVIKNIENRIDQISNISEEKKEIINYINNTNLTNKKEIIQQVNKLSSFAITNKEELIKYINSTNLENRTDIINLIQQNKKDIVFNKNDIINYIENSTINKSIFNDTINKLSSDLILNESKINNVNYSFDVSKKELVEFIDRTTIENKKDVIKIINQNKKDIITNKTDLIEYINTTVLESNVANKVENLETSINQIKGKVYQAKSVEGSQVGFGGVGGGLAQVVNNIRENVNQTLSATITNLTTEYRKKVEDVDAAKPSNILQKFIDAYNTALGFVQFFNNKKNIDRLRTNLDSLKTSFIESFNTAKLLKRVIFKIVKQLSNLPKATGSGGGPFNIDVKIPGPGLKKGLPSNAKNMGRLGKFAALGAGAIGLGAVGATAVNALEDTGRIEPIGKQSFIPENIIDGFSFIVDRFSNAVEGLFKGAFGKKKSQPSAPSAGSSGSSSGTPSSSTSGDPSSGGMSSVSGEGTPEQQALLKTLRFAEGTEKSYGTIFGGNVVKELEQGKLTVQEVINMADTGKLPQRLGGGAIPGYGAGSKATGAYQFMPYTLEGLIQNGVLKPDELFTPAVQDKAALSLASQRGVTASMLKAQGLSREVVDRLAPEWASFPNLMGDVRYGYDKSYYKGQPAKSYDTLKKIYLKGLGSVESVEGGMGGFGVDPSEIAPEAMKSLATKISQPPPTQSQQEINIMPLNVPGGQQAANEGSTLTQPPQQQKNGPSVPFLPSSNPDNFLVLYSRMVYNIVD